MVTEIDLETLNNEEWDELYELWIERALLIFPEAFLSPEGQDEFAKRFSDLEFCEQLFLTSAKMAKFTIKMMMKW